MGRIEEEDLIELANEIYDGNEYFKVVYNNFFKLVKILATTEEEDAEIYKVKKLLDNKYAQVKSPEGFNDLKRNIKVKKIYKKGFDYRAEDPKFE